jgi:hypothetical protein
MSIKFFSILKKRELKNIKPPFKLSIYFCDFANAVPIDASDVSI